MPDFTFTSPQGKNYTVSGPDGSTKEQAFSILQGQLQSKTAPAAPPKQDDPILPYIEGKAKEGAAAIGGLLPLAADVVNDVVVRPFKQLVTGKKQPYLPLTSAYNAGAAKALHYDPNAPVPKDKYGQPMLGAEVAGQLAEFATMSVVPEAGVIAKAEGLGAKGLAAAKSLAGTVAAAEGSVAGGHLSGLDAFGGPSERNTAIGQLAGSMTGPMLVQSLVEGAAKGANWVSKAADKAELGGFTKTSQLARAQRVVESKVSSQLSSDAAKKSMAGVDKVTAHIPALDSKLNLAQRTNSPTLASSAFHYASNDPATLEKAVAQHTGAHNAIADFANKKFPPSETPPNIGAQAVQSQRLQVVDKALQELDRQDRVLAGGLTRNDIEDIGAKQRTLIQDRLKLSREKKDALYNEVTATAIAHNVKVNVSDVLALAQDAHGNDWRLFQENPGIIGKVLDKLGTQKAESISKTIGNKTVTRSKTSPSPSLDIPYSQFDSLVRDTNREHRALSKAASMGDAQAAQKAVVVGHLRDLLQAKMNEMASLAHGEVGAKLQAAQAYYKNVYAKQFKQGVGAEILKKGAFSETATDNARITGQLIFKKGNSSGVTEFLEASGNDPRGMKLIENGVFDMLSKAVVKDGKISRSSLETFLRDYKEPLSVLPSIRKKIETVQGATEALHANTQEFTAARSALSNSDIAKVAKTDNPEAVISQAIKSPKYLSALLSTATPDSIKSVANGVLTHAMSTTDPVGFLEANKAALTKAVGAAQVNSMRVVAEAKSIVDRTKPPGYVNYQKENAPLDKYGTTIPQVISELKAVQQRFSSPTTAVARVAMRAWNKLHNDQIDQLMKEIIYDPDKAKTLAVYLKTGKETGTSGNWLQHWFHDAHHQAYLTRVAAYAGAQSTVGTSENTNH